MELEAIEENYVPSVSAHPPKTFLFWTNDIICVGEQASSTLLHLFSICNYAPALITYGPPGFEQWAQVS